MIPHYRIHNTALAAALATLGVPLDPTEPYSRLIETEGGTEQLTFLFRATSATDPGWKTEDLIGSWEKRAEFEAAQPAHPLVAMRAAHDARGYFLAVIHGSQVPPAAHYRGERFETPHLSEAAILKAHGFPLLLFTGRAFTFPLSCRGQHARQLLAQGQRPGGGTAQWQSHFLVNLQKFLAVAKASPVLLTREGDDCALFSADMPKKEQDRWLDRLV